MINQQAGEMGLITIHPEMIHLTGVTIKEAVHPLCNISIFIISQKLLLILRGIIHQNQAYQIVLNYLGINVQLFL